MTAKRAQKKAPRKKPVARKKAAGKTAAKKKPTRKKPAAKKAAVKKPAQKTVKKVAKKTAKAVSKKAKSTVARPAGARRKVTRRPPKPPTKRFTPTQRRGFRDQLVDKQKELLEAYYAAKGDSRDRQSDGTEDYIDYAVSSYDREFLLSLTELEKSQLALVEEAIRRLDRKEGYGQCIQCDTPIPTKRLEVQPWAKYCVRCQELEERGLLVEPDFADGDDEDDESRPAATGDDDYDEDELETETEEEVSAEDGLLGR